MAFKDLFKSQKERERDSEKKRRMAFRRAEKSVDAVKDRLGKLKKERDKVWAEAKQYLRDGQKAASQRALQTHRASQVMMTKLERKRWVFEQLLTQLELAKTDQEFSGALSALNVVVEIDPEKVDDVLSEIETKLADQADTDKVWERVYSKEMEGVEEKMVDVVPSLDEMAKQIEDEVAAEMQGARAGTKGLEGAKDKGLEPKISEGRKRLKKLMEEEDK